MLHQFTLLLGEYSNSVHNQFEERYHLARKENIPIPEALLEQYEGKYSIELLFISTGLKFKSFLGVFPEINRAWFTIDNRLFIWNYLDG